MLVKSEENQISKKAYIKPEIEITIFIPEDICYGSSVAGEIFGMDGIDIN